MASFPNCADNTVGFFLMKSYKPTNKVRLWHHGQKVVIHGTLLDKIETIRKSELPADAVPYGNTRWYRTAIPERKPVCNLFKLTSTGIGRRKVRGRAGKHRHWSDLTPAYIWLNFFKPHQHKYRLAISSHKKSKQHAHRVSRRKFRQLLAQVEPDGDYNARMNFGFTWWDFS